MLNFHVFNVFSKHHHLFYISDIFEVNCSNNPFRTKLVLELPLLQSAWIFWQTICMPTLFCFWKDRIASVLPWPCKSAVGVNIGWTNLAPQLLLRLSSRLSLNVLDLQFWKWIACKSHCCSMFSGWVNMTQYRYWLNSCMYEGCQNFPKYRWESNVCWFVDQAVIK